MSTKESDPADLLLFEIHLPSGHSWLVCAESEDQARAEWESDEDREQPVLWVDQPTRADAEYLCSHGQSDVDEEDLDLYFDDEDEDEQA